MNLTGSIASRVSLTVIRCAPRTGHSIADCGLGSLLEMRNAERGMRNSTKKVLLHSTVGCRKLASTTRNPRSAFRVPHSQKAPCPAARSLARQYSQHPRAFPSRPSCMQAHRRSGPNKMHAILFQLFDVPLRRGILPHRRVHRGGDQDRCVRCEICRREKVVSDAVGELRDDVRGRRHD